MKTTPQERLALGALALLLAAGGAVRLLRGGPAAATWDGPGEGRAAGLLAAVEDSAARAEARSRPLAPGERLDPNTASADELARLPGVGDALAARIVARRESGRKRYRTLADLDSVSGIGPALLGRLAPHLTLAPAPRASRLQSPRRGAAPRGDTGGPVDLNRASAAELEALPGVGPSLAARIVAWRAQQGPFRSVDELERVPGIGPATVARVRGAVRVTP